ncbi:MAG: CHAT domain-containing tetratricopeptide repeat protein [Geitlerinemataceae cyanobacterium]
MPESRGKGYWCGLGLVGVLLLAEAAMAMPEPTEQRREGIVERVAQNTESPEADRLFEEAYQLFQQGTAESLQQAIPKFEQAAILYRQAGDKGLEALSLLAVGYIYSSLGEKQKALEYYDRALPLIQAVGDRRMEAATLNYIGYIYNSLGEKQKALEYFDRALPLRQAVGDRGGEAATLNNIGGVYSSLGEKQKALEYFDRALPLFQAVGDRGGEATTLSNTASAERDLGNLQTALTNIQAAIDIIEDLRTKIGSQELRASYFAQKQDYYEFYIDLLMQLHQQNPTQGYDSQALHISERARARSLLEQLTEAGLNLKADLDPALAAEEQRLTQALNAADQKRINLINSSASNAELEAVIAEMDNILNQFRNLEAQIRRDDPAYANITYPDPLTLDGIQTQVLDDNTLLLQYALGTDRSYLFLVSKTDLKTYTLPPKAEIEAAVEEYRNLLQSPNFTDLSQGEKLTQMLLGQIAGELNGQRLVIVGDGKLQLLPFAAIPLPVSAASTALKSLGEMPSSPSPFSQTWEKGSRNPILKSLSQSWERDLGRGQNSQPTPPLLANHEIITLPSVTSLAVQREQWQQRQPAPNTLAVIADPVFKANDSRLGGNATNAIAGDLGQIDSLIRNSCGDFDRLPNTATEAEQILALVPDAQEFSATGFEANYAAATHPNLSQYRIVHLATHGCIQDNPLLSNLALSFFTADGQRAETSLLKLQDIYNLELNAELVVLSACQTGTGKDVRGEGVVGLTRGFMYAGARRVAVSLWSVNDRATSILMGDYYRQMLEGGIDPTAAMRQAQLAMWQSDSYSAPYYWAAFTMQGDW